MKMSPLYGVNLFHVLAIVVVLTDALTDSLLDGVIYVFLYPTYGDVTENSMPYLVTYLLPTKPVRRFMVILYIPAVCLWRRAGKRVARRPSCGELTEREDDDGAEQTPSQMQVFRIQRRRSCGCQLRRFLRRIIDGLKNLVCLRGCSHWWYAWSRQRRAACRCVASTSYCILRLSNFCDLALWKSWPVRCVRRSLFPGNDDDDYVNGDGFNDEKPNNRPRKARCDPVQRLLSRRSISWGELVHLNDERYQTVLGNYKKRLAFYQFFPLKSISRLWGRFNQLVLPVWLRDPAFRLYIWLFSCCLEDAFEQDLTKYRNLSEFFRRTLRLGIRPIETRNTLVSPVDGTVLYFGVVENGDLEQVKGIVYSLHGFLGPLDLLTSCNKNNSKQTPVRFCVPDDDDDDNLSDHAIDFSRRYDKRLLVNSINHLYQCIIYLAPGDYHRFHSPADWTVSGRRHFPGELFSVNPGFARWLQGLFNFNERALYVGRWQHGFFSMTAVGATNVGSINVYFDKTLATNVQTTWEPGCFHDAVFTGNKRSKRGGGGGGGGVRVKKGDPFGDFNLGSTVVLLFEAPSSFEFEIEAGQKLRYGQGIGRCLSKTSRQSNLIK